MDKTRAWRAGTPARVSSNDVVAPQVSQNEEQSTAPDQRGDEHPLRDFSLYSAARLGLIVVIAAVLVALGVPLVLGLGVGVIAGYPLSLLLFRRLGARASASMNRRRARRSAERRRLRAELRGEQASGEQADQAHQAPGDQAPDSPGGGPVP
jgi:hypothetical protein